MINLKYSRLFFAVAGVAGIAFTYTLIQIYQWIETLNINKVFEMLGVVFIILLMFFFLKKLIQLFYNKIKDLKEDYEIEQQIFDEIELINQEIFNTKMKKRELRHYSELVQTKFNDIPNVEATVLRTTKKNIFAWEKQIEIYAITVEFLKSKKEELSSMIKQLELLELMQSVEHKFSSDYGDWDRLIDIKDHIQFNIKYDYRSRLNRLLGYVETPGKLAEATLVLKELKSFSHNSLKRKYLESTDEEYDPPDKTILAIEKLEKELLELQAIEEW